MIRVKGYRVLVNPDRVDLKTPAGLIIAADKKIEQSAQVYGTVTAVGERAWEGMTPYAEVGDYVLYSQYAGKVVTDPLTREQFVIMNDEDILAVVDRPEEEVSIEDTLNALETRREAV